MKICITHTNMHKICKHVNTCNMQLIFLKSFFDKTNFYFDLIFQSAL